jgi:hypothetical protein
MIRWTRDERGNIAVFTAIGLTALMALGGGAVTMARLNSAGTRLQDLADGAALAAAVQAGDPRATDADIHDAAGRYGREALASRSEEFTPAAMTVEVARRAPAEVTVGFRQEVRTVLAGFVGRDSLTVRKHATAVSGPELKTCLHVLDPSAASALHLQGDPDLQAPDCMVQVNSVAAGAVHAWGSPSALAQATHIAGPASPIRLRNWSAAPRFGQPTRSDPLAGKVAWPADGAPCVRQPAGAAVLSPGVYCDGLELRRGDRLQPGLYVIQSGGVRVQNGAVTAEGVALVLLDPAGGLEVGGGAQLKLSAPTTGPWAGIAVAAKPGPVMGASTIRGDLELDGTLYLPGQRLLLQGGHDVGGAAANRALIVRQLAMQGSPGLSLAGGFPSGFYGAVRLSR